MPIATRRGAARTPPVLRRTKYARVSTDRKTIFACFEIGPRGVRSSAPLDVGHDAAHHHARLFGSISSSRCQRTCRRPISDRSQQDGFLGRVLLRRSGWWSQTGSNRRPPACKAGALPTELWPLRGAVSRSQQSTIALDEPRRCRDR